MHRGTPLILAAAFALSAQARAADADLTVTPNERDSSFNCTPGTTACFNVNSQKNMTQIFVDVDFGECVTAEYQVFVDGVDVTRFHTRGGTCNHGAKDFERDVWFPLPANQNTGEICVVVPNSIPAEVSVGAKSQNECVEASQTAAQCSSCGVCDP